MIESFGQNYIAYQQRTGLCFPKDQGVMRTHLDCYPCFLRQALSEAGLRCSVSCR